MSIPGAASPLFIGATAEAAAYQIDRSIRLNDGDSAYLNRTPSSSSNETVWTFSFWIKLNKVDENRMILTSYVDSSNDSMIKINGNGYLEIYNYRSGAYKTQYISNARFRDPSSWYHFVISANGSTSLNAWVNGVAITFSTSTGPDGTDWLFNGTNSHQIGRYNTTSNSDFQLAEVQWVDGQALAASGFGEYDDNNVWQPKEYSGTYGTPVNQAETWSSVIKAGGTSYSPSDSDTGFLSAYAATKAFDFATTSSIAYTNNESVWIYFTPATALTVSSTIRFGARNTVEIKINGTDYSYTGGDTTASQTIRSISFSGSLTTFAIRDDDNSGYSTGLSFLEIDGVLLVDNGVTIPDNSFYLKFADNSSNAALGTDSSGNSNTWTVNNITAKSPGDYGAPQNFGVVTWTGDGSSSRAIKLGFQPDFLWIKRRDTSYDHYLWDSIRGITKELHTNLQVGEGTATNKLASFDSDGFTVKNQNGVNGNGFTYVAWAWKAGGTAVSNTDGTITSSVSANSDYGFSVLKWSGDGTNANKTVGHGLSSAPKLIIVKARDESRHWLIWHESLDNDEAFLFTDGTAAGSRFGPNAPTSSVFGVYGGQGNRGTTGFIGYCWSEIPGFSKFGSYSGGTNNQTITTGFKPAFLLIKRSDGSNQWVIIDSERGGTKKLSPNLGVAENDSTYLGGDSSNTVEFLADGFKLTSTNAETNGSGQTHIYAAFAGRPAGEEDDSLIDTPTNYTADSGNNGGNYATLNAAFGTVTGSTNTPTDGNLTVVGGSSANFSPTTIPVTSGKWYVEVTVAGSGNSSTVGIWKMPMTYGTNYYQNENYRYYQQDGKIYNESGATSTTYSTYAAGDVIGIALDMDNGKVYFSKNGTFQGSSVPASGTNPAASSLSGTWAIALQAGASTSHSLHLNAGQRSFSYTPPTGFKALCTTNLPDPTIADGSTAFNTVPYTGNSSTNVISGLGFSPDFVWIKNRSNGYSHCLFDTVRGTGNRLASDGTYAEDSYNLLNSFNSDGFTLGIQSGGGAFVQNTTGTTSVAWAWDGGTSTVSNTDGSITSSVRASQTNGCSIVTYTGTGSALSIGHGLNAAPELVIVKSRSAAYSWIVWHGSFGTASNTDYLFLESTAAKGGTGYDFWNGTAPTSSVVNIGTQVSVNKSTETYVAYCFAPVEGFSSFGSYEGNGSSDGPFVYTGHRSQFLLVKQSSASGEDWWIVDTARETFNPQDQILLPNSNNSEITTSNPIIDILSNGFKLRNANARFNGSGATYIFASFASHPFKTARAR